jgi:plastocyanin
MRAGIVFLLCAASGLTQASELHVTVTDASNQPVADAVVYATPLNPSPQVEHKAAIDQVNRRFVPRVSVIQTGTAVTFPNSDNIRHSVYSFSRPRSFTLKLYAGTPAKPVVFDQPGVVVLGCNIHDTMVAWVLVVDSPFFTRTAADGSASLSGLPPGDYLLRAWNNSMTDEQPGEALHVGTEPLSPRHLQVDGKALEIQP